MVNLLNIFSILAISILVFSPILQAYSQLELLKINEIEINPQGPIEDNQWVELFNPGSVLLDLTGFLMKSSRMGRTNLIPTGLVIEPNGYLVISFSGRVFDETGDSIVLLTPDSVQIDRTDIFSDKEDDDKSWQRFPNGKDTDDKRDWQLRNSTFGISNGFPVARQNFTLSDPVFIDMEGIRANSFLAGQMVGIRSDIVSKMDEERVFAFIIQVKDEEGFPLLITWIEDIVILPNRTIKPSLFFLAEARGEYTVEVFVWASISLPNPLAPPKYGLIRVAG